MFYTCLIEKRDMGNNENKSGPLGYTSPSPTHTPVPLGDTCCSNCGIRRKNNNDGKRRAERRPHGHL